MRAERARWATARGARDQRWIRTRYLKHLGTKCSVFRAQPDRVSTLPEIFGSVATRVSSPRPALPASAQRWRLAGEVRGATKQRTCCSARLACRYRGRGVPMVQPQVRSCVQGRCGAAGGAAAHRSAEHLSKSFQRAGLEEAVSSPRGAGDEPRFMSRSLGTISAICRRTRGRDRRSARLISGTGTGRQVAHRSHKLRVLRVIRRAGC